MNIYLRDVKNVITKSKLPAADYVVNPYIGCTHKCVYCYACFMHKFSKCKDIWGNYIIVKNWIPKKDHNKLGNKTLLISSITDPYQPINMKYQRTRAILSELANENVNIEILTKSKNVLNDLNIIKNLTNVTVGISISSLEDEISLLFEPGATKASDRINTLKILHDENICCYAFISPIIPYVTDVFKIIDEVSKYVNMIYFENLNLRSPYKDKVFKLLKDFDESIYEQFQSIYQDKNILNKYWKNMEVAIQKYCIERNINFKIFFYHDKIRK